MKYLNRIFVFFITNCNLFSRFKMGLIKYILLFFSIQAHFQEIPPVENYSSDKCDGSGNQNWTISQDKNQYIYAANNEGLLEFNGASWKLYPSPNESIIRAVHTIGNRIYTGSYMEFGYWERKTDGILTYTSLSSPIKDRLIEDEHFWTIINLDQWVVFQSFNRLYIYDTKLKKFQFIDNHSNIFKCYNVNNSIYFQAVGEGLYEIINGKSRLVSDDIRLKNNRIIAIFPNENGFLLQTERAGIFKLEKNEVSEFQFQSDPDLFQNTFYCAQKLSDSGYALGTISNGIYILDKNGLIKYHLTQNTGLSNNTVLSTFEDTDHNLWLGLDNGIDCINLNSPIKYYKDEAGYLGTVYAAIRHKNFIYIGTNQGLYYRNALLEEDFSFIKGTKGQVWALFEYDNTLFCGHDLGTFMVDKNTIKSIFSGTGTWKLNAVTSLPNIIIQGNYNGLTVLEKKNGTWGFRNKIEGFDISSKYFELTSKNDIFIGHEYKGIIKLTLDENFLKANKVQTLTNPQKGKHMSLITYNGVVFFAGKQGVYKLNEKTNDFIIDESISEIFKNNEYISGKLNVDSSNKMWLFTKNYMYFFTSGSFSTDLKKHKIPIPFTYINPMLGYENITQISKDEYLIGKTDGYIIIKLHDFSLNNHPIILTNVSANKLDKPSVNLSLTGIGKLPHDQNNITFNYTVPRYHRFFNIEYQYILEGFQSQWSEYNTNSTVNYKNLAPGEYTFKVRAKVANQIPDDFVSYSFMIKKPWYLTNLAILFYLILIGILIYIIHRVYDKHYREQREKLIEENDRLLEIKELENEQQLMKLQNDQLTQDVDLKNKELAVSTMSLIKKNELLKLIKDDLTKTTEDKTNDLKYVISKIKRNITEEDSWNVFREAYDNLDQDFLKKMKTLYPSLTPSDLKLCAYLRLNLSSKEIAPMLHISIRSIEIKRYRLRKKINLPHDESLVNFILNV